MQEVLSFLVPDGNGRMSRLLMNQLQFEFDLTTNINKDREIRVY